jgi:TonB family protein
VVAEVKPTYTAEAMRNRVQGTVTLRGIVERDGTISSIEVLNSLDKMYGLDQAAIDALKQWRFQPGTVDGNPVRVLVNVELTFAIRDRPPSQAWPAGFIVITGGPTADETAESDGVRVTVARPATWTRRSGAATEWLVLRAADGVSTVSAIRPENAAFELRAPAADPLVSRVAESVRRGQPVADAEILGTGQIQSANVFWVWTALRLPRLPASSSAADAERFAEARTWVFIATVNGKVFGVSCTLPIPRGLEPAAIDELVRKAGATFGPIVNSVRIQQVQ